MSSEPLGQALPLGGEPVKLFSGRIEGSRCFVCSSGPRGGHGFYLRDKLAEVKHIGWPAYAGWELCSRLMRLAMNLQE
jgi:hypothetical protein